MATSNVEMVVANGVARLTLKRPQKRNAITAQMWDDMIRAMDSVATDSGLRALLIQGSGGSFCAGADLAEVRSTDGTESTDYRGLVHQGLARIRDFPFVTVALIDGPCVGAGCSIALACDVRFATLAASFAIPAVKYGFVFDEGGLRHLVEVVGSGRATWMMLSGMTIGSVEAASIGLVDHCSDSSEVACERFLADLADANVSAAAETRRLIRLFTGLGPATRVGSHVTLEEG
jgi:enoyl-CoA hydratase/carnithine racemase